MFSTAMKPPFGATQSSFGFNTNAANPFGQSTQMFGNTSGFGAAASTFGQTAPATMFGTPQQSAPLFGQTSAAPAFGQTQQQQPQQQQAAFGTTLFGASNQPQASTSLFGAPSNTSFGQAPKQATGFNFPQTQQTLFGQQQQQQPQQQQASLFQASTSSNIFNSSGFGQQQQQQVQQQQQQAQNGTVVKFLAVQGTDSMQKSGNSTMINTKHHCITCMKEYEGKSLEELRYEDYAVNRKGPQQQSGFGAAVAPFGTTAPTTLFGQQENKQFTVNQGFGASATTGFGMAGAANTGFTKPATGFTVATTAPNTFGFPNAAAPASNLFGNAASAAKPFGTTPQPSLFAAQPQPQQTGFGNTGFFGQATQPQQQPGQFFSKPVQQTFPATQSSSFTFGQTPTATQATSLFQAAKPSTGFSLFPQAPATNFGQPAQTGFGNFNTFNKPATTGFGQAAQSTTFGTSIGGMQQPNTLFGGAQQPKPGGLFGTNTTGLFGNTNTTQNSFSIQPQQTMQNNAVTSFVPNTELRTMFNLSDPYGFSPHLDGLAPMKPDYSNYATNPKDIEEVLKNTKSTEDTSPVPKRLKYCPPNISKWAVFDNGIDEEEYKKLNLGLRHSARRLIIRKQATVKTQSEPDFSFSDAFTNIVVNDSPRRTIGHGDRIQSPEEPPTTDELRLDLPDNLIPNPSTESLPRVQFIMPANGSIDSHSSRDCDLDPPKSASISSKASEETPLSSGSTTLREPMDPIDCCGIVCTRPEYFTVPALDKISDYRNEDGTCYIKGFTIGRVGYGNVYFPDVIDVSDLNIDDILHFRYRELTIYTDDANKPPVGEGLNRRAQITLDCIFPKKKGSRELETDPEVLIADNYAESLRLVCVKHNTTFLDYRPETGSWVFKVEHFSKYGLTDSDEDEVVVTAEQEKLRKELRAKEEELKQLKEMEQKAMDAIKKRGLGGAATPDEYSKIARLESSNNFCTPGFVQPIDLDSSSSTDSSTRATAKKAALPLKKPAVYEEEEMFDGGMHEEEFIADFQFIADVTPEELKKKPSEQKLGPQTRTVHIQRSSVYQLYNITKRVPLYKSLIPSRCIMDTSMLKGRSFKPSWGRGLTLITLTSRIHGNNNLYCCNVVEEEDYVPSKVLIVSIAPEATPIAILDNSDDPKDAFVDNLGDYMQILLDNSTMVLQKDSLGFHEIPFFKIKSGTQVLTEECELANEDAACYNECKSAAYYKNIWNLCLALWGPLNDDEDNYITRKEAFGRWLETTTKEYVDAHLAQMLHNEMHEELEKVLILLSGHSIKKASKLAMKLKAPQLSLILSQINSSERTKGSIKHQICYWRHNTSIELISQTMQKIYLLLSGNPVMDDINVCETFDWLRSFGLHFWYICPTSTPIFHSIKMYQTAYEEYAYCVKPMSISGKDETYDILYHIMQMYCNKLNSLELLLDPQTHTVEPTDYRLSWILLQTFSALNVGLISSSAINHIAVNFASQLEHLDMYKWAIFVLLNLPDIQLRKTLILQLLDRNILEDDEEENVEDEIVTDLCLPVAWIHQVKANKSKQLMKYWHAYQHLAYSNLWFDCNEVVLKHIVPELIANHEYKQLSNVLQVVSTGSAQIYRWRNRGGLLIDFLNLYNILYETPNYINTTNMANIYNEILVFAKRVRGYPTTTTEEVMTISEVSKLIALFVRMTLQCADLRYDEYLVNISALLNQLVMPSDYKYVEIAIGMSLFASRSNLVVN